MGWGGNFLEDSYPGRNYSGAIVLEANVQREIVLGGISWRVIVRGAVKSPGGNCPGGSFMRSNRPGAWLGLGARHDCSPVNMLHMFRIPFSKYTFGSLILGDILKM